MSSDMGRARIDRCHDARISQIIRTVTCSSMQRRVLWEAGLFERYIENFDKFPDPRKCEEKLLAKEDKITDAVEILYRRYIKGDADREASMEALRKAHNYIPPYRGGVVMYCSPVRRGDAPPNYYSAHKHVALFLIIFGIVGFFNVCAGLVQWLIGE